MGTKTPAALKCFLKGTVVAQTVTHTVYIPAYMHRQRQPLNAGIFQRDSLPADPENAPRGPAGWHVASPGLCRLHPSAGKRTFL